MKKSLFLLLLQVLFFSINAQNIAIGKNGAVVTTIDGGNTWLDKRPTTGQLIDVIGISKSGTNNWVISQFKSGSGNYIQRTTDGGSSYTTLATNLNNIGSSQSELMHFGADTLLLLHRNLSSNAVDGFSVSNLTSGTPTFSSGNNTRAPYYGLTKYNATSALVINNQISGLPVNASSEIYKLVTKTATTYCFTSTSTIYEHAQLTGSVRVDANTLFAVGNVNGLSFTNTSFSGFLYKSTDNGASWSVVSLPTIPGGCALMGIGISPNKQNIVVAGTKNYVAFSSNGGSSWSASTLTGVPTPTANWVYTKVAFADDNTVIVGGTDQTNTAGVDWYALRSTNGGTNFTAITTLTDANYTDLTSTAIDRRGSYISIYFVNSTTGYAVMGRGDVAKKFEIMKTTDGGATWSLITWASGAKPSVNSIEIINHLSGENDLVVNSLSGKNLWEIDITTLPVAAGSIVSKYTTKDLRGTYKKNALELYAIELATTTSEGGIYKSTDGGLSWTLATAAANGYPMLTITEGFVGGYLGRAFTANSDFSTLTRTAVLGHYGGNMMDLSSIYKNVANTSSSTIFAIGEAGGIFKSTNTGTSFSYIGKPEWAGYTYTAISAVDANIVYVCGYNTAGKGIIIKTTNGGTDWTKLEFENVGKLNDIEMYNATQGLAVGNAGVILGTVDGEAWVSKSPAGLTDDLLKVVCDEPVSVTGTPEITTVNKLMKAGNGITFTKDNKLNIVAERGAKVFVYNLLGVIEYSEIMKGDSTVIELTNGAKIIKVERDGSVYSGKVVIR